MSVEEEREKREKAEKQRQQHILNQLSTELYTDIHLDFITSVFYMLFKSMIMGANGDNRQMDSIIAEWEKDVKPKYIHIPKAISNAHSIDFELSKELLEKVFSEVISMIRENTRIDHIANEPNKEIILLKNDIKRPS